MTGDLRSTLYYSLFRKKSWRKIAKLCLNSWSTEAGSKIKWLLFYMLTFEVLCDAIIVSGIMLPWHLLGHSLSLLREGCGSRGCTLAGVSSGTISSPPAAFWRGCNNGRQYFERGFVKSPVVPCTHMVPLLFLLWDSPMSSCSIQLQRGLKDCPIYCLTEKTFHSLSKDKGQGEKGKDWFY